MKLTKGSNPKPGGVLREWLRRLWCRIVYRHQWYDFGEVYPLRLRWISEFDASKFGRPAGPYGVCRRCGCSKPVDKIPGSAEVVRKMVDGDENDEDRTGR